MSYVLILPKEVIKMGIKEGCFKKKKDGKIYDGNYPVFSTLPPKRTK